jgi:hypothetical protein
MRTAKLFVLGLVLGAASLAAQPELLSSQMSVGEAPSLLDQIVQGDRLLFYRIPANGMAAAKKSFVIRLNLDGRPFTEEAFRLNGDAPSPLTVELLGLASDLLDRAYEKARQSDHQLSVTVLAGGKVAADFTWEEFLRYNRQIRKGDFRPVPVPSEVRSFFSPWPPPKPVAQSSKPRSSAKYYGPDHACAEQCQDQFNFCYYDYCDQRGSCAYCNDWYNSCIQQCPIICEDPKKVEDVSDSTVVAFQPTGNGGCYIATKGFGGAYNFMEYRATIKTTYSRKTTYCDGSTSVEPLSTTYSYTYCYNRGLNCSFPIGYMYNEC